MAASRLPLPIHVVMISLDRQLEGAVSQAEAMLRETLPGLKLSFHAASDWAAHPHKLDACKRDIATANYVVASMLFLEPHIEAVRQDLIARRDAADAMVGCLAATEIVKTTKLGRFDMDKPETGAIAFLKRLRGTKDKAKAGAHQAKMLKRLPKLLRYIPGTAQDVRAYFLCLQYYLAGSTENVANLVRFLINRYAEGEREHLRGTLEAAPPIDYPDMGVYHPHMAGRVSERLGDLPNARSNRPAVGLVLMRSYILSGDTGHYDGVIAALEARGLRVVPVFSSALDSRDAIRKFMMDGDLPTVDSLLSLTGFSLVGGPAYNDADAAAETLAELDLPYVSAQALEFQSLAEWRQSVQGLTPIESTMMVAIPELDGATGPTVYGGRGPSGERCEGCDRNCKFPGQVVGGSLRMQACLERAERLAARLEKLVALHRVPRAERKVAITLFNFPPGAGATGTAAFLAVYESLFNTLTAMADQGYDVAVPESAEALKDALLTGNSARYGSDANVAALMPASDHVRNETRLAEIEAQWGPAPGRQQSDGRNIHILGAQFGNVFVGIQPALGIEGDPMRLLFDGGFAPTHAFAAYYRYLRDTFGAHAVLHFGTHGALEFMPGKQIGLTSECWPDYLIDDLPNVYFYASNNPSEAAIAKRRSAATTVTYLTPAVTEAGLYQSYRDLRDTLDQWDSTDPSQDAARANLASAIHAEAVALNLVSEAISAEGFDPTTLAPALIEMETALIPDGMHVAGKALSADQRIDILAHMAPAGDAAPLPRAVAEALVSGAAPEAVARLTGSRIDDVNRLAEIDQHLQTDHELPALIHALDGGFIRPVAGGNLTSNPDVLPTGRNIHGFDPYRLPSAPAVINGTLQADKLIARHVADHGHLPETIAVVLWGTDNLKSEGAQLSQALALMGARPRRDSYGRLAGADLIPLDEMARPRIDVVATLSGIFRDLLPHQSQMLAEAALKAASAENEPADRNFVRKHALAYQAAHGCDLETAALRVFSNAEGAYGANVNQLVDAGCWEDEDSLADAYTQRKCFAYGVGGKPIAQAGLLNTILADVDMAYQNLESVELGITTIDHYFDTLGGIGRAVKRARGDDAAIYIGDETRGDGIVRTLSEQVALETRTRTLNPKWYEGMLRHGYEGVRQIEAQVTNTFGWSATTEQVDPWVYEKIGQTFVLDDAMRNRLASLNPKASANLANRLLEASDRNYWTPDPDTLAALQRAGEDLEDRVEGIIPTEGAAA